jgi:hypothetical protein
LRRTFWQKITEISEAMTVALMMEVASTSETSINVYQITRPNIPEDVIFMVTIISRHRPDMSKIGYLMTLYQLQTY